METAAARRQVTSRTEQRLGCLGLAFHHALELLYQFHHLHSSLKQPCMDRRA